VFFFFFNGIPVYSKKQARNTQDFTTDQHTTRKTLTTHGLRDELRIVIGAIRTALEVLLDKLSVFRW